ncbi:MAG TPA: hypothetical protein VIM16_16610 [Mucilaginibacter sp.]|jgi:hypothetical protein
MKSIENGPIKKKGDEREDFPESQSEPEEKGVYSDNDKSKNYNYGDDDVNGPNWDKDSKDVDGDTGQNAGVFK